VDVLGDSGYMSNRYSENNVLAIAHAQKACTLMMRIIEAIRLKVDIVLNNMIL